MRERSSHGYVLTGNKDISLSCSRLKYYSKNQSAVVGRNNTNSVPYYAVKKAR